MVLFSISVCFSAAGFTTCCVRSLLWPPWTAPLKDIEFYKLQHGRYPAALSEVEPKPKTRINNFIDPTSVQRGGTLNGRFYYELDSSGSFYYLRSVGPDGGIPFHE